MRSSSLAVAGLLALAAAPSAASAQDVDLSRIFSNDDFYEESGLLHARGDVTFVADAWFLPADGDSTRVLLGVVLSNEDLQFVRTGDGGWRAVYAVTAGFRRDGDVAFEETWQRSVDVRTFDETMLSGETIVFQTELGLAPGTYEASVTVRDENQEEATRARREIEVPDLTAAHLGDPVLLRLTRAGANGTEYVVHPSHYYPSAPPRVEFLAAATGVPAGGPLEIRARLVSEARPDEAMAEWTQSVTPEADGTVRVFGAIENDRARFGEYALQVAIARPGGEVVAESSTPILIAASGGWIVDHWREALSLIRYEATDDEMDILEEIRGDEARVEAWNCFWAIRDPVETTAANEGMQEYFRTLHIANRTWKSALRPGFQSDRGRVYITLGAPDDVREEPMPMSNRAYEVWSYQRYNFQLLFVDDIGFNNYQLAPQSVGTYQRELSSVERRKRQFLRERSGQCPMLAAAFE